MFFVDRFINFSLFTFLVFRALFSVTPGAGKGDWLAEDDDIDENTEEDREGVKGVEGVDTLGVGVGLQPSIGVLDGLHSTVLRGVFGFLLSLCSPLLSLLL